eukprot:TRINITY_DN2230_c0_g1_i2.p1 TRINITY_DN2230_c0_g1~~TRINITY_DN2230_c0_g1_i2.p1  ORF type:complete len:111 (-),score=14.40 TRINITY_DN2230_c0_g1_i2:42-374(-)
MIISLLVWQVQLVSRNTTTIEVTAYYRAKYNPENRNKNSFWPYDLGFWLNIKEVLGYNFWFWFVPINRFTTDGLRFPLNPAYVQLMHESEPLKRTTKQPDLFEPETILVE